MYNTIEWLSITKKVITLNIVYQDMAGLKTQVFILTILLFIFMETCAR